MCITGGWRLSPDGGRLAESKVWDMEPFGKIRGGVGKLTRTWANGRSWEAMGPGKM